MPDIARKTVSAPGLYTDIGADAYHADPCPEPSLSRSVAKTILERTPRHAFIQHPRLRGVAEEEAPEDKLNVGNVAHELLLGKGAGYRIIDWDSWRTNAAKLARGEATAAGLTPILEHQMDRAIEMAQAVREQLPDHGISDLFNPNHGRPEVVGAWIDPVAGWSRFMADWMTTDLTIWDIKTTAIPLSLEVAGRHCASMGYEFQDAFYTRGMEALHPELAGRVRFNFLFIEIAEPFAILPIRLPGDARAKGSHNVAIACERWAAARKSGLWPMFSGGIKTVDYPPWQVAEWADYQDGEVAA